MYIPRFSNLSHHNRPLCDHNFPKKNMTYYTMGYNLKSAGNGKSISKIPKWPSLRPLALKSKFIPQFELLKNLEYTCTSMEHVAGGKALLSNNFFHTNLLRFLKFKPS